MWSHPSSEGNRAGRSRTTLPALALAALILVTAGCRASTVEPSGNAAGMRQDPGAANPGARVRVQVTQDFAARVLIDRRIPPSPGMTVMDALRKVAKVETQYGGGFVSSINGLESTYGAGGDAPRDWFYYVNGRMAKVGAADKVIRPGDVIRWDYHRWSADDWGER